MTADLRIACIGAGYFSRFHYDAWSRIPGASPVASVDRDIDKARATGLAAYETPEAMLTAQTPDIVDIITPPEAHLDCIRRALAVRPKAIICQKPFCRDLDEAREAAALSQAAGIPVVVHENFRFQPWYRVIRAQMDQGALGDVHQITFRLRPGDGQGPRAYLDRQPYFQQMPRFLVHETAVHWIDTFRYLMGSPDAVFADLRRMNPVIAGEDAGTILFSFADGKRALFDANRLLDHSAENTRCTMGEALVEGTEGTIDLLGDGSLLRRRFGTQTREQILPPSDQQGFGGDCVFHLQSHVVNAIRKGGDFENLAHDYLSVIETENAIYIAARTGAWVQL